MSSSKCSFDPYERNELSSETRSITQSPKEHRTLPDSQLVIRAQAGSKTDFDLIYERYYNQIYRFQTRMVGDSWIGEELAQETFFKAWRALNALRDPTKFLSWLYRIAANEISNYYRHPEVPKRESLLEDGEASISGPEAQVEAQEHLEQALARVMSEKCRACLILYHIDGYSIPRIAEFLGIKQSSVRQYISSGLNQLKRFLEEDDTSKEER